MAKKPKQSTQAIMTRRTGMGGVRRYHVQDYRAFTDNPDAVREAIYQSVIGLIGAIMRMIHDEIEARIESDGRRVLKTYDGREQERTLFEAYREALGDGMPVNTSHGVAFKAISIDTLDKLTPRGGEPTTDRGWWELYEFGGGASSTHAFFPAELLRALGFDDEPFGKYGEGVMIDVMNNDNMRGFLESGVVSLHPGVKPNRFLHQIVQDFGGQIGPNLMEHAAHLAIMKLGGKPI